MKQMVKLGFLFKNKENFLSFCDFHDKEDIAIRYPFFHLIKDQVEIVATCVQRPLNLIYFFSSFPPIDNGIPFDRVYVMDKNKHEEKMIDLIEKQIKEQRKNKR